MTELYIDIGNSRSKFATKDSKGLHHIATMENSLWFNSTDTLLNLTQAYTKKVTSVYVSCVAGKEIEARVMSQVKAAYKCLPVFLKVEADCCDLKIQYEPFYALGVDRWLNLLGVKESFRSFTVFDLGSAITVDTVIEQVHMGGLITPGLSQIRKSILDNTAIDYKVSDLQASRVFSEESFLAQNTQDAILAGSIVMVISYVNHMMAELRNQYGLDHSFVLTGGDAESIYPMLNYECTLEPWLVFQGIDRVVNHF